MVIASKLSTFVGEDIEHRIVKDHLVPSVQLLGMASAQHGPVVPPLSLNGGVALGRTT